MTKRLVLKEYCKDQGSLADTLHEVENFMREKEVSVSILSANVMEVVVKGNRFRMETGLEFPRSVEEDKLFVA